MNARTAYLAFIAALAACDVGGGGLLDFTPTVDQRAALQGTITDVRGNGVDSAIVTVFTPSYTGLAVSSGSGLTQSNVAGRYSMVLHRTGYVSAKPSDTASFWVKVSPRSPPLASDSVMVRAVFRDETLSPVTYQQDFTLRDR